jgi:hypothetical protein
MTPDYKTGEQALDVAIRAYPWMDFHLVAYDEVSLIVRGTLDLSYGYQLQIEFGDVGYLDCPMTWRTATHAQVFSKVDPATLRDDARERFFDGNGGEVFRFAVEGVHRPWFAHVVAARMRFFAAAHGEYLSWSDQAGAFDSRCRAGREG